MTCPPRWSKAPNVTDIYRGLSLDIPPAPTRPSAGGSYGNVAGISIGGGKGSSVGGYSGGSPQDDDDDDDDGINEGRSSSATIVLFYIAFTEIEMYGEIERFFSIGPAFGLSIDSMAEFTNAQKPSDLERWSDVGSAGFGVLGVGYSRGMSSSSGGMNGITSFSAGFSVGFPSVATAWTWHLD